MLLHGRNLAAITDWVQYLRDLIAKPAAHPELNARDTMGTASSLGAFAAQLAGTPFLERLNAAGLVLVEQGTADERAIAGTLPFGEVEAERVVEVLARGATTLPQPVFDSLLDAALRHRAADRRVTTIIEAKARQSSEQAAEMLLAALPYLPDWVIAHVGPYAGAANDPNGEALASLLARSPAEVRRRLLDAIAAAGPDHVARTLAGVTAPSFHEIARERIRADLAAHRAFDHATV
ncbi:MAG: hypothetical protein H0T46_22800 [Deltaproteobacteria bacterium]|nr:hypothetical protein [Deltaproteobacteria bacterium]